jgi:hypothetical protein
MLLNNLRLAARNTAWLKRFIAFTLTPSGFFDKTILNYKLNETMSYRLKETCLSPDNDRIVRVPNAGKVINGKQVMHNGLRINLGSYYGPEVAQILLHNKGVHEPQEEYVFSQVLPLMPKGATMIEMGSFWAFYSMWFQSDVPNAKNFMIEPEPFNIESGKRNFKLNGFKGEFTRAFIAGEPGKVNGVEVICVDDFVEQKKIEFIHLLHSDIQGYELQMLHGASATIAANKIGYIFISTHTNKLHDQCIHFLQQRNFSIVAAANLDETFSEDGLVVAKAPGYPSIDKIDISLKRSSE